jgi:hypothetical protein
MAFEKAAAFNRPKALEKQLQGQSGIDRHCQRQNVRIPASMNPSVDSPAHVQKSLAGLKDSMGVSGYESCLTAHPAKHHAPTNSGQFPHPTGHKDHWPCATC